MAPLPLHVLLVAGDDDDVPLRELLASVTGHDMSLERTAEYDVAREDMARNEHDVYFVDYRFGEEAGLGLVREARAGGCSRPIIMLTGPDDRDADLLTMDAGATDCLVKSPINAALVDRSLRYALEHARLTTALQTVGHENSMLASGINHLLTGVLITDPHLPDNPIILANSFFTAMTGYTDDEVIGRNCRFLQGPETDPEVVQEINQALDERMPVTKILLNYRKDGTPFWNELTISPIFDANGDLRHFVGLQSNITTRKKLEEARGWLAAIVESSDEPIISTTMDGIVKTWNEGAERLYGYTAREMIGQPIRRLEPDDHTDEIAELLQRVRQGERISGHEVTRLCKDGSTIVVSITVSLIKDARGAEIGACTVARDVTARKAAEQALRESEQWHRDLFEVTAQGVVYHDAEARVVSVNSAAIRILGATAEQIRGNILADVVETIGEDGAVVPRDAAPTAVALQTGRPVSDRVLGVFNRVEQDYRWIRVHAVPRFLPGDSHPSEVLTTFDDITERLRMVQTLEHRAFHDPLTDLPNRTLLLDRIQQALPIAQRDADHLALLVIDLDRVKDVVDTLGHPYGDQLLREVGARIKQFIRASDTAARIGDASFAVLSSCAGSAGATWTARKITAALNDAFVLDEHRVSIGVIVGIALYPDHGSDPLTLLRRADVAKFAAQRAGHEYALYDPAKDRHSPARLAFTLDLREAIDANRLVLHYQPKVDIMRGAIVGVEALVRWPQQAGEALLPPGEFISLAESTGLIVPLTQWVLQEATRQWGIWKREGHEHAIAVNITARVLKEPRFPERVAWLLRQAHMPPSCLTLEITEHALMTDSVRALDIVTRIAAMGVHVSIDDFGTGYSSLGYLSRLSVDEIKIDRAFILGMNAQIDTKDLTRDRTIVRSIIDLGHNLGLRVVAEGIEDQMAWEQLAELGCDIGQGYFVTRPLPADELDRWMRVSLWARRKTGAG